MDLSQLTKVYDLYELYLIYKQVQKRREPREKKLWIHAINELRGRLGAFACLMPQLKDDPRKFLNYCRMSQPLFQDLLRTLKDDITKSDTNYRKALEPELKLMLTLRFLATGASFQSLHYEFRVGNRTAREAVYDVCAAIWRRLKQSEMPNPTEASLRKNAEDFFTLWQYPHCMGAIDGKHVYIRKPSHSGSQYYNYKGRFSIVLQAVADANGLFTFIDVGDYGRQCDAGVFKHSSFGQALLHGQLPIPDDEPVAGSEPLPYVFIGDEAYPLSKYMMKPYARRGLNDTKRIYNYRHSRARRVVECTFGMMTAKWGVLSTEMNMSPDHARLVTLACCVLHNFVRRREGVEYNTGFNFDNTLPREAIATDAERLMHGRPAQHALHVRDCFASIMTHTFPIPWQNESAHVHV